MSARAELEDARVLLGRARDQVPVPVLQDDVPLDGYAPRRLDGDRDLLLLL